MSISAGTRIGPYEVISLLGAGGMGEVYRARDSKLQRDVALKILPAVFATDSERVARFEREAQVLASLNHPNIAAIYGFEEGRALVLELVDGPTLADRIAQGPVPIDEALPIAKQIAEALEAAHEHGVIHRDLKPANIKLRADGTVKVLDFGLAKLSDPTASGASSALSLSPTITTPAPTQLGVILGTAAYMAPEQARGKTVDKRADIWAFGCVLYELLAGAAPFADEDVSLTLSKILQREPEWRGLPADTPAPVIRLLRRALQKEPKHRLPDIGTARMEIDDALAAPAVEVSPTSPARRQARTTVVVAVVGTATGALAAALVLVALQPRNPSAPPVRAQIPLEQPLEVSQQQPSLAISPDGSRIVFRPVGNGPLHVRLLSERQSVALAGTERAFSPFFSPDGQWVGFFIGSQLKKLSLAGGALATVASLPVSLANAGYRGATWTDEGTIIFAPSTGAGLFQVSDQGGEATPLTTVDQNAGETNHRWPQWVPGRSAVLFTIKSRNLRSFDDAQIVMRSIETGEQQAVAQGAFAQYASSGHVVYGRAGALYAVPIDADRLGTTGPPVKVIDGVTTLPESGAAQFGVSRNGALVYAPGDAHTAERQLLWVDRRGNVTPVAPRADQFALPRISRDGRRVTLFINSAYGGVWIFDVDRGTFTRASEIAGDTDSPVWGPTDSQLTFSADTKASGIYRIYTAASDGSGAPEVVVDRPQSATPQAWSPDGRVLLFLQGGTKTGQDVWSYSVSTRSAAPFLDSPANEFLPTFSHNGRWVAYVSDESGRPEVYVRPFPGPGMRLQISTEGGTAPIWSRDGRELFFARDNTLYAIPVNTDTTFRAGAAQVLFSGPFEFGGFVRDYDVAPDARRFIVPRSRRDEVPRQLELVVNWFEELRRLAPAN